MMAAALRRLLPYVERVRPAFGLGLVMLLASLLIGLASPLLLRMTVDGLSSGISRDRLGWLVGAILVAAVIDGWLRFRTRRLLFDAAREVEHDLRAALVLRLTRFPPAFYASNRTGSIMARLSEDTAAVRTMLGQGVVHIVSCVATLVAGIGMMIWLDPRLAGIALLPMGVALLDMRRASRTSDASLRARKKHSANVSSVIQESLSAIRLLKATGRQRDDIARFERSNATYLASSSAVVKGQALTFAAFRFSFFLSAVFALWFGGLDVISGRLTLGEFVAFGRYQMLLGWPITSIGWTLNLLQSGMISWRRIVELLDTPDQRSGQIDAAPEPLRAHTLELRQLSFRYGDDAGASLDGVSLTVRKGEILGIVGQSGAGKSTITAILSGLIAPPAGSYFIDGLDVATLPAERVRAAVAVAAHAPFLFSDSIAANVGFGLAHDCRGADRADAVRRAAHLAMLSGDVERMANGYDTTVGERGLTLSGGQRQRVALARAIAVDRPVLILDDALSEVDGITERGILSSLRTIRQHRIVIVVAHRASTMMLADRILVLEDGRLTEAPATVKQGESLHGPIARGERQAIARVES